MRMPLGEGWPPSPVGVQGGQEDTMRTKPAIPMVLGGLLLLLTRASADPEPVLVKDVNAEAGSSSPFCLTGANGRLFWNADDGIHGGELWKSDGTADGTVLVKDINPGASSSSPEDLTGVGGRLFFRADDGTHGVELWVLALGPVVLIEHLITDVADLGLPQGTGLEGMLDAANRALADVNEHNDAGAVGALQGFASAVEALRGSSIPEADADALIAAAQTIIDLLQG